MRVAQGMCGRRWVQYLALALLAFDLVGCTCGDVEITITGSDAGVDPVCADAGGITSYTCQCVCTSDATIVLSPKNISVCLPPELNECSGGIAPTVADLDSDCSLRVQDTVQGMVSVVQSSMSAGAVTCTCTNQNRPRYLVACDANCVAAEMPPTATDYKDGDTVYTHVDGDAPVCASAAIDPPVIAGIAGALYAPRTICDVAGSTTFVSPDIGCPDPGDQCPLATSGIAGFVGPTCPEGGCGVDFGLDLDVQGFTIDIDCDVFLFGDQCEDVDVSDISVTGVSMVPGGAVLDSTGTGTFQTGEVEVATRLSEDGAVSVLVAENATPADITVDWIGGTCEVTQDLPEVVVSAEDASVTIQGTLELDGTIANQPPRADAGPDEIVECTSPAGALVTLDGSASEDRDDNIVWYAWRDGVRFSDTLLSAGPSPIAMVEQALDATQLYSLRVFDSFSAMDHDTTTFSVVDTTAPEIGDISLKRTCLWPPNHKYVRFALGDGAEVPVSDVCDAAPVVTVDNVVSSQPDNATGDGNTAGDVLFGPSGFCLRSERAGGTSRTYTITFAATDGSGNVATKQAIVVVPANGTASCPVVPNAEFVDATNCTFP